MSVVVKGVGRYRQRKGGPWVTETYNFGFWGSDKSFEFAGCTPTSITNILVWTRHNVPHGSTPKTPEATPSDTNNKTDTFWHWFGRTRFRDLTKFGKTLGTRRFPGYSVKIELIDPSSSIERASPDGKRLIDDIKASIDKGKPVLLGVRGGGSHTRHSIVAAGYDDKGELLVVDPWTNDSIVNNDPRDNDPEIKVAAFARLDRIMKVVGSLDEDAMGNLVGPGYTHFDMAFEATYLPNSYLETPSPEPGPRVR